MNLGLSLTEAVLIEQAEVAEVQSAFKIPPGHWAGNCLCGDCLITIPELSPKENKLVRKIPQQQIIFQC